MQGSTPLLTALFLAATLAACSGGDAEVTEAPTPDADVSVSTVPSDGSPILAEVSGVPITVNEFEAAAARETPANGESLSEEEKREVLETLINDRMLYLEAKRNGIDRDPKVQKVMVNTLLRQDVYSGVRNADFSVEELRAYYDEHKAEFVVPEKVQVKRIFVKVGSSRTDAEAQTLIADLHRQAVANPASFSTLATEHSEDPYRRRGGDLGYVSLDGKPGIDQAVVEKAFTLDVDQISEPFQAGGGYHIVMIAGKRERVERTFEQMKGSVLRKVKNDRYKVLYKEYVAKIGGRYDVSIHEDILATVEAKPTRRVSLGPGMPGGRPPISRERDDHDRDE